MVGLTTDVTLSSTIVWYQADSVLGSRQADEELGRCCLGFALLCISSWDSS